MPCMTCATLTAIATRSERGCKDRFAAGRALIIERSLLSFVSEQLARRKKQ